MCKKLMFLILFVIVLGLVSNVYATKYKWTNAYPWSQTYDRPWNWDPVAPWGGPQGAGNRARIVCDEGAGAVGPALDTTISIERIEGPARGFCGDQEMWIVKDCDLTVTDRWIVEEVGSTAMGTMHIWDNATVNIGPGQGFLFEKGSRLTMNMTDETSFIVDGKLTCGDTDTDYFELNMDANSYMSIGTYGSGQESSWFHQEGELHVTLSDNAVIEADTIKWRMKGPFIDCSLTVQDDAQLITYDTLHFGDGEGNHTIDVLDNAIINATDHLILAGDNDYKAGSSITVNMSGQAINLGRKLFVNAHTQAYGTVEINLTSGVIDIGETIVWYNYDLPWVINICGDGYMVLTGDQEAFIRGLGDDGKIVACLGLDCFGNPGSTATLMVDYNNEIPGRTKVWAELFPEIAWAPQPADGAVDVPSIGTILCWCNGENTEVSHLYLGTDEALVAAHDGSTYQGALHETNCYDPGPLMLCTTYYWTVVEQDYGINLYPGPVWSFTVECCRGIEDFEAYTLNPDYIWDTWIDGCGDLLGVGGNATGSCITLTMDENHGGAKAMTYTYENEPYGIWDRDANYSEATRTFDPPMDLTQTGEAQIIAWFYGDAGNDLTDMWALLNGSVADIATYGDNGEDPADIQSEEWISWHMDLAGFPGVDLSSVATMSLGFGDVAGNVPDSALGIVRFDDISTCPVQCIPKFVTILVDFNGDCKTDMIDIGIFTGHWLEENL